MLSTNSVVSEEGFMLSHANQNIVQMTKNTETNPVIFETIEVSLKIYPAKKIGMKINARETPAQIILIGFPFVMFLKTSK